MPYRISGHETGIVRNPRLLVEEQEAMVELGVGKNMVRSIRFWSQAADVVRLEPKSRGYQLTRLGAELLGDRGHDQFLEDIQTLWLIHWNLATSVESPLLAWDYLMNRHEPEIIPSRAVSELEKEASKDDRKLSSATVKQHFDTFIHTYVPPRGRKGEVQEDDLDCPLVELELLLKIGDREIDRTSGRREPVYAFRRDEKPEISQELFLYCLHDFWTERHGNEQTLSFSEVAHGHGGPGQIFKLAEDEIRARLEDLAGRKSACLKYIESANLRQLRRSDRPNQISLLQKIYSLHRAHA